MQKLLENSMYVSAVNQTASDLTSQTSSIRENEIKNTFITIAKVVVILLILGILAWIAKKYQNIQWFLLNPPLTEQLVSNLQVFLLPM